ncbi:MAG: DUF6051 family protein [Melioribacteraceae bacterium]
MTYKERFDSLKKTYKPDFNFNTIIPDSGIEIQNRKFISNSWKLLPGGKTYFCEKHNREFEENLSYENFRLYDLYPDTLKHDDIDIIENREFSYTVFRKNNENKNSNLILLFHGLNEKYWEKYLPWAEKLVKLTGKTVLLFPIAFHMNRVPAGWSNIHSMNSVAQNRRKYSKSITNSTFANAAISARVEMIPQRFFWSGLQTFYDVVKLIGEIKAGKNELIHPDAEIDLFSYSIGSFLSEILLMSNPRNYFDNSKLFMFCGGPTLDRMAPNSKFILDSDATIALYSFYTERLESELKLDKRIAHYFSGSHTAGNYFKAMLSYRKDKELRESRLRELSSKIYALPLKNDDVVPPNEVLNTLQGDYRDIPVKVDILDFPYAYSHITPFPATTENEKLIDENFNIVFDKAAQFLRK